MSSLDDLPQDQRAVLELVLRRGLDYDEIAQMLSIDRAAVRDRAQAALDALGPPTSISAERRQLTADYLLGQLPPTELEQTRERLAHNPDERAWALAVGSEVAPLASGPLPEIPSEPGDAAQAGHAAEAEPQSGARRRSTLLGAVLLGLGAVVAVVVVLVFVVGGSSGKHSTPAPKSAAKPTSATSTTATATPVANIALRSPTNRNSIQGIAEILRRGSATGIAIVAEGMAPNTKRDGYAVWLYNSRTDCVRLGFVNPGVGKNGRLETAGGLPADAGRYKDLLVSLETTANPRAPTHVVLEGVITGLS